jgi:hypothetical protein
VLVKAAAEAERVAATEAERVAEAEAEECEVTERAAHWAAEMDKALAYRRNVNRRDVTRWEAARCAETEHRIEQRMIVRRQEAALSVSQWRLSRPPATTTEALYSRETAVVAT